MPKGPKRLIVLVLGILAALTGLLWVGQGTGIVQGSYMTGSDTWLGIGLVCLSVGALLIFLSLRRPPGNQDATKSP